MARKARHGRTMNSVSTKRFPKQLSENTYGPTERTLLMIQMAKDFGYDAYWVGDKAVFGDLPIEQYNGIEILVDAGWSRKLDNENT